MNKKGELTDGFIFIITLFILAIGLFVIIFIIPQITSGLKTAGLNNSVEGASAINSLEFDIPSIVNNGFLMIFLGLVLSTMITSFFVRTHPIFLFLYIFFLAITLFVGIYVGNAFYQFEQSPIFASALNTATYIHVIMNNLVEITLAVGALSMIIVFAKFSTFGGTQQF